MSGRKRRLLIALAVIVALVGAALGSAAVYVSNVEVPGLADLPQSTTVYYSDGRTVMARLGEVNRTNLEYQQIPEELARATVVADEPDFWSSSRGAIARRVVRVYFDLRGSGVTTRARVAVAAGKLEDEYSKEQVLAAYLNAMPYGRRAFGVEAAAQAYFGKSADRNAPAAGRITTAEAIALASLADQPGPEPSSARWGEVRDAMVGSGWLERSAADALTFPKTIAYDPKADESRLERPTGLVVNHVLSELAATSVFQGRGWDGIRNGGYRIVTTLDATAQALLERTANATVAGSAMHGQPETLQAAAVSLEPGTGRVLAYFGGHNGLGSDYAGIFTDEQGDVAGYGAHRPGTSFFVYALAAALKADISLNSRWDSKGPRRFPGRTAPVVNASTCARRYGVPNGPCTLLGSTVASLNVPYYAVTQTVGSATVLEMAKAAGIAHMWTDDRKRVDLDRYPGMAELSPARFAVELTFGQYPVTVLDQATGMATFAADGVRADTHFVKAVRAGSRTVYSERLPQGAGTPVLTGPQLADLTWALSQTGTARLKGVDAAGKSGAWIDGKVPTHAWMIGYTRSLATAVWVGSAGRERPLTDRRGAQIFGSGLPTTIYRTFMDGAHAGLRLRPGRFAPPAHVGDDSRGDADG